VARGGVWLGVAGHEIMGHGVRSAQFH
jgi:hypothetical protein